MFEATPNWVDVLEMRYAQAITEIERMVDDELRAIGHTRNYVRRRRGQIRRFRLARQLKRRAA